MPNQLTVLIDDMTVCSRSKPTVHGFDEAVKASLRGVQPVGFGEAVKAVVQPANPRDAGPELEAEIITYCREHLSSIKCPRSVDFDAELPRHENGKLYKRLIKDRYWGRDDTRIV